jgi:hypothetical protein
LENSSDERRGPCTPSPGRDHWGLFPNRFDHLPPRPPLRRPLPRPVRRERGRCAAP